jgi:hypothetical protein
VLFFQHRKLRGKSAKTTAVHGFYPFTRRSEAAAVYRCALKGYQIRFLFSPYFLYIRLSLNPPFMKTSTASLIGLIGFCFFSCGMSREEKTQIVDNAATMRANSFCSADTAMMGGSMATYQFYLDALSIGLKDQGVDEEGMSEAMDLFDKKIKDSCPEKYPK